MNQSTVTTFTAAGVLLASLALAGCGKREDMQAARNGDNTAVVQGQPAAAATDTATKDAHEASEAARQAANDMKDSAKNAADQASNKVADAVITTSVNAELSKDPKLSALRINVDTEGGRVALKGTAPDQAAKERATQLASNVKGVVSVDNQLTVEKG
ncbi:MAG TPA: BON domain-containing protein [Albitalea sp.]|nr:BON domain-containing protein [Albitalea sp.]